MATEAAPQTAVETSLDTINHWFAQRARETPDRVALRRKIGGQWEDVSWKGYWDAARKIGLGLVHFGLEKGQAVAILSQTRAEWAFCDMGVLGVGGATVPIYQSNTSEEARYILEDSEARFLFVENLDQWRKIHPIADELTNVVKFFLIDTNDTESTRAADVPWEGNERVMTFDALLELGEGEEASRFEEASVAATLDDRITLIYTSGTTGAPKGVVLSHRQAATEADALASVLDMADDEVTLAFLPLAHVFARALHWTQFRVGYQVAFAESIDTLKENMPEIRPTFFAAVPRVYEKFHAAILGRVNEQTGLRKSFALWGLKNAIERDRREREGESVGVGLRMKTSIGKPAVEKVRLGLEQLTGGRLKYFISGGAPLSQEIAAFFHTLGFPIYEGYGLTETTAATHLNRPGAYKLGTVGQAIKGIEHEIADDGEILVRGGVVMQGYHKRPDATAEVLGDDGWFHTGDIGEIDDEGFLRITDRKKDLIVTAAGKNVAPQNVENHLKTHRLVSQAALFGDKQKFCVALITLDEVGVRAALQEEGAEAPATYDELVAHPRVKELVQAAVDEKNADLASYETIKYFEILPKDFEIGDELTPTLKVRRKTVLEKYEDKVDALYAGSGGNANKG